MRIISVGKLLEGIQLQMTPHEYADWQAIQDTKLYRPIKIASKPGKKSTMHIYVVAGMSLVIYEAEDEKMDTASEVEKAILA